MKMNLIACIDFFSWEPALETLKSRDVVAAVKKMSESQTKAGNQRKFENLKI